MNLLHIGQLTEYQVTEIYELADKLRMNQRSGQLSGKTFVLFFPESSIRTRLSFEKGIKDLGGSCIVFPPETLDKREHPGDVSHYIGNWADGIIIRHSDYAKLEQLAAFSSIPVINAMTADNHPCEILSDLYTISRLREDFRSLVYTFVGGAGNISRSWMDIAKVMDLNLNHVCTEGHELGEDTLNYRFHTELEEVLRTSDVILTDSLPDQLRTTDYMDKYRITLEKMKLTKEGALLNPCPPFFRNEEISDDAIASDYFVGYAFKRNLLYVQQAIILYCCGIEG